MGSRDGVRPRVGATWHVEELSRHQLGALGPEWARLWARCPDAAVFQHPRWLLPWWRHFGAEMDPWVVAVRRGEELMGLAPLGVYTDADGQRAVTLMGGEPSDYHGILARPPARQCVATAVLTQLALRAERWDRGELGRLEPTSPLLDAAQPGSLRVQARAQDVCPFLALPPHFRRLDDVVPPGFAKRIAQSRRRARRSGRYEAVLVSAERARERIEVLFRLHQARWRARGVPGVLGSPRVRAFQRCVSGELAREGVMRLLELRLDGVAIACIQAFVAHGRMFEYLTGFDPQFAHLSPGRLALAELVERALAERLVVLDLLRGIEPYKYDWGARDRQTCALHIHKGNGR